MSKSGGAWRWPGRDAPPPGTPIIGGDGIYMYYIYKIRILIGDEIPGDNYRFVWGDRCGREIGFI